jgi:RNA polymerase sigma-70 factor, ECF subfamily
METEYDASLVRETLNGDKSAFGTLYDRYARIIRAICFDTTRDVNGAQELTQEAFLRAFTRLPQLRRADRFGPWLVSIARHVCREWCRSRRRDRHRYTANLPELIDTSHSEVGDTGRELRMAITKLPERERTALHLLYMQGDSAEVARSILGLSHSGFYKVVLRARERLAEILSGEQETIP